MTRACSKCEAAIHGSNRVGICLTCQTSRTCEGCGIPVSVKSTGRCRVCANALLNADPAIRAKKSLAMKRVYADPLVKESRVASMRAAAAKRLADPAERERLRQWGRVIGAANIGATRGPAARAKAGRSISAQKLQHVPAAYRGLYMDLRRQNLSAADRLRLVMDQQAADARNAGKVIAANENAMIEKHRRDIASRY